MLRKWRARRVEIDNLSSGSLRNNKASTRLDLQLQPEEVPTV